MSFLALVLANRWKREHIKRLVTDLSALAKAREAKPELSADEALKFDAIDAGRDNLLATEKRMAKVASLDQSEGRRTAAQRYDIALSRAN
jgi:hypothetical protein